MVAALAIVGCGGPSAEDLRSGANEACTNTLSRIRAIGPLWGESRRVQADRSIQMAGRLKELLGDLREFDAPDDLASDLDSYEGLLAEQERGLEEINELTAPPSRVQANLDAIDNGAGAAAAALGFDDCENADVALQAAVRRSSRS